MIKSMTYSFISLTLGVLAGITPHGVKALRNLINDSFLDTMYYMSPRYGPEVGHTYATHTVYSSLFLLKDARWPALAVAQTL